MTSAQFLIDTSALARLMRPGAVSFGWDQAVTAGLIAVCPITELEFFYSARSARDREDTFASLRAAFSWVPAASPRPGLRHRRRGHRAGVALVRAGLRRARPAGQSSAGICPARTPRVTVR
jgi:predicted nucleic acid-binding protein